FGPYQPHDLGTFSARECVLSGLDLLCGGDMRRSAVHSRGGEQEVIAWFALCIDAFVKDIDVPFVNALEPHLKFISGLKNLLARRFERSLERLTVPHLLHT